MRPYRRLRHETGFSRAQVVANRPSGRVRSRDGFGGGRYLGPARDAEMLEIVTIVRDDDTELANHAMKMRDKYQRLLPEG